MKHMRSKHNSDDKFVAYFNGNNIVLDPENCEDTFSLNENEPTTKQINNKDLPVLNETNENDLEDLDREAEDYLKDAIGIFSIDSEEIMEHGDYYQYLKLEQSGEHLHALLNTLERQFACIKNVAERYYHMIKKLINNSKIDDTLFEV